MILTYIYIARIPSSRTHSIAKSSKMARKEGVLICVLIVMMDVVAGILGIEAQVVQNKVSGSIMINETILLITLFLN